MKAIKYNIKKRNQFNKFDAKQSDFLKKIVGGDGIAKDESNKVKI
ncbi:hypothetical protein [Carboxylicivirga sp. N1Y90]